MSASLLHRAFSELEGKWVGRSEQIRALIGHFGNVDSAGEHPAVFIHGPAGTGKSCIARDILFTFGYVVSTLGGLECDCPLGQVWTYVLSGWQRELKKPRQKPSDIGDAWDAIKKVQKAANSRPLCVLIDALDCGVELDLVYALLEYQKRSPVPFRILLISSCPWSSLYPTAEHNTITHHICFPGYSLEQILAILEMYRPDHLSEHAFETLLARCIKPAVQSTRLLTDAQTHLELLLAELPKDCTDGDAIAAHLNRAGRSRGLAIAENFYGVPCDVRALKSLDSNSESKDGLQRWLTTTSSATGELLMEVPRFVKLLIIAAFIVGNNRPSANRRVFSNAPETGRKRKGNAMDADKQAQEAEDEAAQQGQAFTPECWLQVFFKLVELQDPEPGQQLAAQFGAQDKLAQSMQASWIHSQMRQLAAIHVVKQNTKWSDGISGVSYISEVSHSLAESLAQSVGLSLKQFLVYV